MSHPIQSSAAPHRAQAPRAVPVARSPGIEDTTGPALSPAQLIAATNTSRGVLRVYERCGLIAPIERSVSGYRRYSPQTVDQLRAIRTAKELGFSLAEIADMLGMGAPGMSLTQISAVARQRAQTISMRIAQLEVLRECFLSYAEDPAQIQDPECDLLIKLARAGTATETEPARTIAKRTRR